ncbi:MAG: hypothetical protein ABIO67_00965 [Mycobacteriales bacterium]
MIDLVVATFAFTLVVALVTVALVAVTVVPLYVALQLADARGFSPARWVVVTVGGIAIGLGSAYVLHGRDGTPRLFALLPLILTYVGPASLFLLESSQRALGGRAGRHE